MRFLTNSVAEIFEVELEGPWGTDPGWGAKFDSEIGDFIPDWSEIPKATLAQGTLNLAFMSSCIKAIFPIK